MHVESSVAAAILTLLRKSYGSFEDHIQTRALRQENGSADKLWGSRGAGALNSVYMGFLCGSAVKSLLICRRCRRCRFTPCVEKIPWSRKWQTTPVFLLGISHGQRGLAGFSPWHCRVRHD